MRSSLTPFGQQHLGGLVRLRIIAAASAFVVAFAVQLVVPSYPLTPLLILLAVEVLLSCGLYVLPPRLAPGRLWQVVFGLDIVVVTGMVLYTGGIRGGFATLYVWIALVAALIFGARWFFVYGAGAVVAVVFEVSFEALGLLGEAPAEPFFVAILAQFTLLAVLVAFAYLLTRANRDFQNKMQGEQVNLTAQREQAERARRRWELVNTVALRIQESTDPLQVYAMVGAELEALEQHAIVWSWQEADRTLRLAYVSVSDQLIQKAEAALPFKRDNLTFPVERLEYVRQCIESRTPVLAEDPLSSALRGAPEIQAEVLRRALADWSVERAINAPLLASGRVLGVLTVWGSRLEAADIPSLAALAQQVASALDKAVLLAQTQKRAAQLELVSLISAQAGAIHEARELMDQVVAMVAERFGYPLVAILLLDRAEDELRAAAVAGVLTQRLVGSYVQPAGAGIIGWVARTGETYLSGDVRSDPHYLFILGGEDPIRSELAVPLWRGGGVDRPSGGARSKGQAPSAVDRPSGGVRSKGQVVGVLDLESTEANAFDASDVAAMETLAEQISVALDKAQALATQQKRATQLAVVNQIAARIAGVLDVNAVLEQVTRMIVERFGFENTSILMNDAVRREAVLRAHSGRAINPQPLGYRQPWEVGLIGAAARTGETVVVNDVRADRRYYTGESAKDICRAELCIPLKRGEEVIGILDVQSAHPEAFEAEDVSAIETLADQVAVALENARLLDTVSGQLEAQRALTQFSQALLETVDRQTILDGAARCAAQVLNAEGALVLLPEGPAELWPRAVYGWENTDILSVHVPLDRHSLPGTVMLTREAARWSEEDAPPPFEIFPIVRAVGYHAGIAAPMLVGQQAVGVIVVNRKSGRSFSENDTQMLALLANQTAIALERARLYAQNTREAEVKAALLRELSHRVKNNLAAIASLLYLALDNPPERREEILNETLGRVQSMVASHTLLSRSDRARVSLLELGQQVLNDTVRQLAMPGRAIEVTAEGEAVDISPHEITTLTLVLNELATNAVRHGLVPEGGPQPGKLHLRVEQRPPLTRLIVEDNGQALPENFDLDAEAGLGLNLVRTLVEMDLRGRFELEQREGWTRAVVSFRVEE